MYNKYSKEYYDYLEEKIYSAAVSDCLDSLGYWHQSTDPNIRPLIPDRVLVGRAKTIQVSEVNRRPKKPYEKLIEVMDSIEQGDILVAALGGSKRSGFFGELLGTITTNAGGRGAIVDGTIRDAKKLKEMNFPIFSKGFRPTDSFGRNEVVEYGNTIECGGVTVQQGDLVIADIDGIVIVPASIEEEVVNAALEKVKDEDRVREKLLKGMPLSEAFYKYEIL